MAVPREPGAVGTKLGNAATRARRRVGAGPRVGSMSCPWVFGGTWGALGSSGGDMGAGLRIYGFEGEASQEGEG
jgi:hypothetical protein